MAKQSEAEAARDLVFDDGARLFGMRPRAAGIIAYPAGGFGVKVTLPHVPEIPMPSMIGEVPVEYDYATRAPALTALPEAAWMATARATLARRR